MNACVSCKHGKRKCDRARPSCTNCLRLAKACVYEEDIIQTNFAANAASIQSLSIRTGEAAQKPIVELPGLGFAISVSDTDPLSHELLRQPTIDMTVRMQAIRILGSLNMSAVSAQFFSGTHQRFSVLSKTRFYETLPSLNNGPHTDFLTLCLSIYLIQQKPSTQTTNMQSSLYVTVKGLINLLESTGDISLDIVHCRLLLTLYEFGHGLNTAAYVSIAACARSARVLGFHKKPWYGSSGANILFMEEEKRVWWAIVNLDRFIGLCSGDALFATDDPEGSDLLPIQDLLWFGNPHTADVEAPILATPAHVTIGQMARECQAANLTGRVVKHVFDPTSDIIFNAEEAVQLERTLKAFIQLLADEDLKIGKYCGALGICHSALFILYEFAQIRGPESGISRDGILESMEEASVSASSYGRSSARNPEHFRDEISSPFLPYAYFQTGIVQYRCWRQNNDPTCRERIDLIMTLLEAIGSRWLIARKYLQVLANLDEDWPPITLPHRSPSRSTTRSSP